jgi:protease I
MATVLMPLPDRDFDPTETGVPWKTLTEAGHRIAFATPNGKPGMADPRMVTGEGLGIFAPFMQADASGRAAYASMIAAPAFQNPLGYAEILASNFDALLLPGGHAKGMRTYLESPILQSVVAAGLEKKLPIGAICHGVLLAARARAKDGKSVLYGRKTTGLTRLMELGAWVLTVSYLGSYYRTYPTTVEAEVKAALARPDDFLHGPVGFARDAPGRLQVGFTVRDGNYLSARWPGDAHRFAKEFAAMLPPA